MYISIADIIPIDLENDLKKLIEKYLKKNTIGIQVIVMKNNTENEVVNEMMIK